MSLQRLVALLPAVLQLGACNPTSRLQVSSAASAREAEECTFTGRDGTDRILQSHASCESLVISALNVPKGRALSLTNLSEGATVVFQGITTFELATSDTKLVTISGSKIKIRCEQGCALDGQSTLYQNAQSRPEAVVHLENLVDSSIDGIVIKNAPTRGLLISDSRNLSVRDLTIDKGKGVVSGENDCVTIASGSNIEFVNGACSGGDGLTVGPVGKFNTAISNVTFADMTVEQSQKAAIRVQSFSGADGSINEVTFRNIAIRSVGAPGSGIVVDQSIEGHEPSAFPPNGVSITNLRMQNVSGTVDGAAANIAIRCGMGDCHDWAWTDVNISGGGKQAECINPPPEISC